MTTFYIQLKVEYQGQLTLREQSILKQYVKDAVLTSHGAMHPDSLETIVFGDANTKVQAKVLAQRPTIDNPSGDPTCPVDCITLE